MSGEISTIQSLKAVDAWIDVINANINGGVRTAFKSSRLKFSGSNPDVQRAGNTTSLPLQFPESGLTTANTVIDFSQGAITASTENTHLAIQGDGFFALADPAHVNADGTLKQFDSTARLLFTRDGEFHTNQDGMLVHSSGYVLITCEVFQATGYPTWAVGPYFGLGNSTRAIYNDLDLPTPTTGAVNAMKLSDFLNNVLAPIGATTATAGNTGTITGSATAWTWSSCLYAIPNGKQSLQYSTLGSTVFDARVVLGGTAAPGITFGASQPSAASVLSKSLEASNSSMTQSVPELSLAQKLFSALTKVLQTKQTNVDGVLNLVR